MITEISIITNEDKQQIASDLQSFVETPAVGSNNRASAKLGVSVATVSNMVNGKHDNISDNMWRKVQSKVSLNSNNGHEHEWQIVKTKTYCKFERLFDDAAMFALTMGIIAFAGTGKTSTADHIKSRKNFYVIKCADYFNKRIFLQRLLSELGKPYGGYSVGDMMDTVIDLLIRADHPVIVLDEADKLPDSVLYFFISLYNELEDKCGLILMATDYLSKRLCGGLKNNKKGYEEIWSRIGRKLIQVQKPDEEDLQEIISSNGITDAMLIQKIINQSDGDIRRIKRLVFAEKRKMNTAA